MSEKDDLRNEIEDLENEISDLKEEILDLETKVDDLEDEIDNLKGNNKIDYSLLSKIELKRFLCDIVEQSYHISNNELLLLLNNKL